MKNTFNMLSEILEEILPEKNVINTRQLKTIVGRISNMIGGLDLSWGEKVEKEKLLYVNFFKDLEEYYNNNEGIETIELRDAYNSTINSDPFSIRLTLLASLYVFKNSSHSTDAMLKNMKNLKGLLSKKDIDTLIKYTIICNFMSYYYIDIEDIESHYKDSNSITIDSKYLQTPNGIDFDIDLNKDIYRYINEFVDKYVKPDIEFINKLYIIFANATDGVVRSLIDTTLGNYCYDYNTGMSRAYNKMYYNPIRSFDKIIRFEIKSIIEFYEYMEIDYTDIIKFILDAPIVKKLFNDILHKNINLINLFVKTQVTGRYGDLYNASNTKIENYDELIQNVYIPLMTIYTEDMLNKFPIFNELKDRFKEDLIETFNEYKDVKDKRNIITTRVINTYISDLGKMEYNKTKDLEIEIMEYIINNVDFSSKNKKSFSKNLVETKL